VPSNTKRKHYSNIDLWANQYANDEELDIEELVMEYVRNVFEGTLLDIEETTADNGLYVEYVK
jgi:hypothetical protein